MPVQPIVHNDVLLTPTQPKQAVSVDMEPEARVQPAPQDPPATFVPPQPERPVMRAPRMPRVDELPVPAQNQIRANRGEEPAMTAEQKRMTLLQRLATVGFGNKREEGAPVGAAQATATNPAAVALPLEAPRAPSAVHAEYVKRPTAQGYRPAQGNLDPQGRVSPAPGRTIDDDNLEIPAFLRRQSKLKTGSRRSASREPAGSWGALRLFDERSVTYGFGPSVTNCNRR
jgi:cell division protein FtsZ